MDAIVDWLLAGSAWVEYRTRVDLLEQSASDPRVAAARQAMVAHPQIAELVAGLAAWPGPVLSSHKSAGHPVHQLTFLADIGLRSNDPGMDKIILRILQHASAQGPFRVRVNIPVHFGGTGQDTLGWALCDAPLVTSALVRFGHADDPRVAASVEHLTHLVRDSGFPCAVSPELGKFRGPGRKDDPCPYADLIMLRVLAQVPRWRSSRAARTGVETLLALWETRRERHPYQFYMGTDFCKIKAPLVWYDILHVLDVLTQYPQALADPRLQSMGQVLRDKAVSKGHLLPESIWKAWSDWDFGQKRQPSYWLTFLARRILHRVEASRKACGPAGHDPEP